MHYKTDDPFYNYLVLLKRLGESNPKRPIDVEANALTLVGLLCFIAGVVSGFFFWGHA